MPLHSGYWWGGPDDWQHAPAVAQSGGESRVQIRKWTRSYVHFQPHWADTCHGSKVLHSPATVKNTTQSFVMTAALRLAQRNCYEQAETAKQATTLAFVPQSFSTSDAAAEAAVLGHADTEPREAAAAGPSPAQTVQLCQQQRSNSSHLESGCLWFPWGSDGKSGLLTVREGNWICRSEEIKTALWFHVCFQEYYVPCTLSKKPLLILHFILHMKLSPILCFTNSRETAHRLEKRHPRELLFCCTISCQTKSDFFLSLAQTFASSAALWRSSGCRVLLPTFY